MPGSAAHRAYWYSANAPLSIGCVRCPDYRLCGGQRVLSGGFDCLDHCCGTPTTCSIICPHNREFVDRIREVDGLDLCGTTLDPIPAYMPAFVPVIYSATGRSGALETPVAALKLFALISRSGTPRYGERSALLEAFKLGSRTRLVLTGVAEDWEVEKWWGLGRSRRRAIIESLRDLGIAMVTTPNFSLTLDQPRWGDLHSMRRIQIVHEELVEFGQASALHVNARCDRDFERWGEYVADHRHVTHLAYEFATGAKHPARLPYHTQGLCHIARMAGRRMGLVIRGGSNIAPLLAEHFDVTLMDTSLYEKAQHREEAYIDAQGNRGWLKRKTPQGAPIDDLFARSLRASEQWAERQVHRFACVA